MTLLGGPESPWVHLVDGGVYALRLVMERHWDLKSPYIPLLGYRGTCTLLPSCIGWLGNVDSGTISDGKNLEEMDGTSECTPINLRVMLIILSCNWVWNLLSWLRYIVYVALSFARDFSNDHFIHFLILMTKEEGDHHTDQMIICWSKYSQCASCVTFPQFISLHCLTYLTNKHHHHAAHPHHIVLTLQLLKMFESNWVLHASPYVHSCTWTPAWYCNQAFAWRW